MGGWRTISAGDFGLRRLWVLALGLLAAAPAMRAQTEPPIHVNVRLVNVFVNVTDTHGAPVPGLTKQNFALSEDGRPQKIAYFERQTNVPLSIVLAIDTSGSTRKDVPVEKAAAHDFIRGLLRPADRLDLMDFNSDVREVVPFTSNVRLIDAGLAHLDYGPATALYDAVYLASQRLDPRHGRKVLVLISDGGNTKTDVDFMQALEAARRGEVMVYSIIDLPIIADAGRDTDGEHAMITLSQETGGQYYYANAGSLREVFRKVSENLRTQYLLGYYPNPVPRGSGFRKISVRLIHAPKGDGPYTVQNRTGYYPDSTP
ncbi:MAG: VWA domain-containing protein [Acetobacteraceae bacterium]